MQPAYPADAPRNDRVLTVIGNRPQFIKAAAVSGPLRAVAREILVHTGQHYDEELSQVFFDELELPRPEHRLDLGGGTNTDQTARMLAALEPLLARRAAGAGARLRRHELHARGRARGRAGRDPGRARRGRHALVRPHDAGGAQPRAHRSRERPAAVLRRGAGRDPARRAASRARSRSSATSWSTSRSCSARAPRRARRCWSGFGVTPRRLRARHRPPRGQRRRPGAAGRARGAAAGGARARSCSRCTRGPPRGSTRRACGSTA